MARDYITSKFVASITVDLVAVNKYGETLGDGGTIRYSKTVEVKNLAELGVYLQRLDSKPFEFIQMVDPPSEGTEEPPF